MDKNTKDKIEKLKKKQEVLRSRIQIIEAREKSKERRLETRKKILVGSYFIEQYISQNEYEELKKIMDKYLTRESDRKVFELNCDKNTDGKKSK